MSHQNTHADASAAAMGASAEPLRDSFTGSGSLHSPYDDPIGDGKRQPFGDAAVETGSMDMEEQPVQEEDNCLVALTNKVMPRGGTLSGVFNLASITLGAGIISIPAAFNTSGMVMAILYLLVLSVLTVFSINLLIKTSQKTGLQSFEAMGRGFFGRGGDIMVACLMWLLCFGGAVGYVIATGDVLSTIFNHDGIPEFWRGSGGRRLLVSMIWLFFMFPLVLPKQINSLRYVSVVGVAFIIFFVICVVVHSSTNGLKGGIRKDLVMVRPGNSAVSGLAVFMFAFICQVNVFKIAYEKKRPTPRKATVEASISCSICCLMYFLTGFFGYADFGPELNGNILQYYNPYENPVFFVCFIGLIVKLCAAFSLNMLACRTALFQVMQWNVDTMPYWKHTIFSASFAIGALILGLFVPDISIVFGLVGAFCGGFIGFVFPALFWMYAGHWSLKTVGIWYYLGTYFLLLSGVVAIVFGTGSSIYRQVVS